MFKKYMEECVHRTQMPPFLAKAKIKNKFVSPYPTDPVKIGRLKFSIENLTSIFFFLFYLVSLKIRSAENSVL